jgi:DNA polymerase II large subunit
VLGKKEIIQFAKICSPKHKIKKDRMESISKLDVPENSYTMFKEMIPLRTHCDFTEDIVKEVEIIHDHKPVYCLDIISKDELVHKNVLWGNQLFQVRCDGDEICFIMLMDALLNFSRQYLPDRRGGRAMDAPLVLTTRLDPQEVDDEVYNMDIADFYPLSFYDATMKWASPYDVKIRQIRETLGKPEQYFGMFYTHPTENINHGCRLSAYKTLTTVFDKVQRQMELAERIRAVNKEDVAKIIIEKHFLKDIKGNLRKYSKQEFRCIACNQKYRRIPLMGRCNKCAGKLVLTVAEGTVSKYLEPSIDLAEKYSLPTYLKQTLEILKRGVDSVFGKEPTKQVGLNSFFGKVR